MAKNNTVGILLAAGISKRFSPFITNKPFFPFMGLPFIQYGINALESVGVQEIIVVTNDQVDVTGLTTASNIELTQVIQPEAKGMGEAMLRCQTKVNGRPMIVKDGTNYCNDAFLVEAKSFIDQGLAFVPAIKVAAYQPCGYLTLDDLLVKGVVEKPGIGNEPSHYIKSVFDFIPNSEDFFALLKKTTSENDDVYERALNTYFATYPVRFILYQGTWTSLKYSWYVLAMISVLLKERLPQTHSKAFVAPSALIEGEVYLGKDVRVMEGAVIKGPTYIGDRTVVGTNTLIRASMIENDSEIGFGSEVVRSYVGPRCKVHRAYIGDSVLESNVRFGAGTTTANLRLDQKNITLKVNGVRIDTGMRKLGALIADHVSIGIHVGLMPGVRVKSGSLIKPGEIIYDKS